MTGFKSKKAAALDEEGMYLVHHTESAQESTLQEKDRKRWVDLTDEEIQDCDPHEDCWHLFKIARAVLAKSKEKNNG